MIVDRPGLKIHSPRVSMKVLGPANEIDNLLRKQTKESYPHAVTLGDLCNLNNLTI
jgi:hypothetical protein